MSNYYTATTSIIFVYNSCYKFSVYKHITGQLVQCAINATLCTSECSSSPYFNILQIEPSYLCARVFCLLPCKTNCSNSEVFSWTTLSITLDYTASVIDEMSEVHWWNDTGQRKADILRQNLNFRKQSPSKKANNFSASQEIYHIYRKTRTFIIVFIKAYKLFLSWTT
jgi:hypothetical protein